MERAGIGNSMNESSIVEQDGSVSTRTKAEFPSGLRFGLKGSLDGDDLMQRILGTREDVPPQQEFAEDVPRAFAVADNTAWKSSFSDMTITITEGDIEIGPDDVIAWGSIIDHDTGLAVASSPLVKTAADGSPTWFVWVNVNLKVTPRTAELFNGATITALTDSPDGGEKYYMRQKRICKATITNDLSDPTKDVINKLQGCQCGNVDIPLAG